MTTQAILATLKSKETSLQAAVPQTFRASLTLESIYQAVGLACEGNEKLRQCDPRTVYTSVLFLTRLGLDVSGYTQEAYLVPFWNKKRGVNECQPMIGQQGKIELAFRTGKYASIVTEVVHKHDHYVFDLARRQLEHSFDPEMEDRGPGVFAYCRIWLVGFSLEGPPNFQEIMSAPDFAKIEKNASRGGKSPAYKEWRNEMWRRSVLSRGLKRAPKSVDLAEVLNQEAELHRRKSRGDVLDVKWDEPGDKANGSGGSPQIAEQAVRPEDEQTENPEPAREPAQSSSDEGELP